MRLMKIFHINNYDISIGFKLEINNEPLSKISSKNWRDKNTVLFDILDSLEDYFWYEEVYK